MPTYSAGYIPSKKKKVQPTITQGGYSAGYVAPKSGFDSTSDPYANKFDSKANPYAGMSKTSTFDSTSDPYANKFDSKANPYAGMSKTSSVEDYYEAMGLVDPKNEIKPPPPPKVEMRTATGGGTLNGVSPYGDDGLMTNAYIAPVVRDGVVVGGGEDLDGAEDAGGEEGNLTPEQISIRDRLINQAKTSDMGVLNDPHFATLSPADQQQIRSYLGLTSPAVGKPVATAEGVAGLGEETIEKSVAASEVGFDDQEVRERSKELLRTILGESEEMGRQATENLQLPEFQKGALEGALESFLMQQMGAGFTGDDPMTRANIADFDASAGDARRQQIEDLQRYGVLGDGVSAGFTADVLGGFDADVLRGRGALQAEGQRNLLNSILPQAQSLSQFQGNQQTRNREFEAGYNMDRLRMEQDIANQALARRMPLTGPTGDQVFQESVRQANLGNERADRGMDMQLASLLGVTEDGRQTLGAQQLGQQDRQFNRQMNQQDEQFLKSLGLDQQQIDLARGQALGYMRDPVTGVLQDTLGARQLNQQGSQFDRSLAQSNDQFLANLLGVTSDGQDSLAKTQLDRQAEQDRISQILAASKVEGLGINGSEVSELLRTLLGIGRTQSGGGGGGGGTGKTGGTGGSQQLIPGLNMYDDGSPLADIPVLGPAPEYTQEQIDEIFADFQPDQNFQDYIAAITQQVSDGTYQSPTGTPPVNNPLANMMAGVTPQVQTQIDGLIAQGKYDEARQILAQYGIEA